MNLINLHSSDEEARPLRPVLHHPRQTYRTAHTIHHHYHLLNTDLRPFSPSGSDADPFANEGRETSRDTTEGLDQERSDHPDPYHTTLGLGSRVSEPKGGIDVLKESFAA